jgi:hypothetical protein
MDLKDQVIPYNISVILKRMGFKDKCFAVYNREKVLRFNNLHNPKDRNKSVSLTENSGQYAAPTWEHAFNWFRLTHNLHSCVAPVYRDNEMNEIIYWYWIQGVDTKHDEVCFDTPLHAKNACISELIRHATGRTTEEHLFYSGL